MIKFIKRIWRYDDQDWKHIGWCLKETVKDLLKGNTSGAREALFLLKLHLLHDSERINK